MPSFAKRFNKEKLFTIDTEGFEYFSLEDLYRPDNEDMVFPVRGIYLNKKSLYGPAYVLATDDCYVNLPDHLNDDCEEILKDKLAISDINRKVVGFKIYKYVQKKYNRECYSITWVDVDPNEFTAMNHPETGLDFE